MGCFQISTKGDLAPLIAQRLGTTVEELDTKYDDRKDDLIPFCGLAFQEDGSTRGEAQRAYFIPPYISFIDDGDGDIEGDDLVILMVWDQIDPALPKEGENTRAGFVGGRLKALLHGYESLDGERFEKETPERTNAARIFWEMRRLGVQRWADFEYYSTEILRNSGMEADGFLRRR